MPSEPYAFAEWRLRRVGIDYHVEVEAHFYSVPYRFARREVEVRLTARDEEHTVLELEHVAAVPPEMWDRFGPGGVGVGWDLAVLGLGLHLAGGSIDSDKVQEWLFSDEVRAFMTRSSQAWGRAYASSGAPADVVAATVTATTDFYVPPRPE